MSWGVLEASSGSAMVMSNNRELIQSMAFPYNDYQVITINDSASATPYPAFIDVTGSLPGLYNIQCLLNTFTHEYPADVDIMLVNPADSKLLLMANASVVTIAAVKILFDDNAVNSLPYETIITSGSYKPTAYTAFPEVMPTFPPPCPTGTVNTTFADLGLTNYRGYWKLFVVDDNDADIGVITNWSLIFQYISASVSSSKEFKWQKRG